MRATELEAYPNSNLTSACHGNCRHQSDVCTESQIFAGAEPPSHLSLSSIVANSKRRGGSGDDRGGDSDTDDDGEDLPAVPDVSSSESKKSLYVGEKTHHFRDDPCVR